MKKTSTVQALKNEIFKRRKLTIGLDLGDRWSFYCVMDEAGRHHALRRGKEAMTTPWRSVQDAEKADEAVAWQALGHSLRRAVDRKSADLSG